MKKYPVFSLLSALFCLVMISSCQTPESSPFPTLAVTPSPLPSQIPNLAPITSPSATLTPTLQPTASPTPLIPDTGWIELQAGLHRRLINILDEDLHHLEQLYVLRFDPDLFSFDIAYDPEAKSLEDWQDETDALVVFNGGFYRIEDSSYIPNGLTVIAGEPMGVSYGPFGGMFAITEDGPNVRWLSQTPYDPDEFLLAALQSFPVLVKPGGVLGFPEENEDNIQARRSVIGQRSDGYILFIIASKGYFTLHTLSTYLIEGNFKLDLAINLDGGPSSGLVLSQPYEIINSYVPLPLVITVFNR